MAAMGVHIVLSLPNGTACTAEMDQVFEKFKPACSKSALWICVKKMHAKMTARKVGLKTSGMNDDDVSSEDGDIEDDDRDAGSVVMRPYVTSLALA